MITIKEIADIAGVSLGTVDRVLHNRGRVSSETIKKVRKIADENGYVPNQFGSRLRKNRRYRFGVLLPDRGKNRPFWKQIVRGIEEARKELESLQIEIVYVFFSVMAPEDFISAGKKLLSEGVDAYIVAPFAEEAMRSLVSLFPDIPYVFVDSSLPGFTPKWNFAQNPVAAGQTGAHLMRMILPDANQIIALPIPSSIFNSTEIRANSFKDAYSEFSPQTPVSLIASDDINEASDSVLEMIAGVKKTGIFVVNSQASILCNYLEEHNFLSKCSVIGFDLSDENRRALKDGRISAVIGQRPQTQGHDAIITMFNHFVLGYESSDSILSAPIDIYLPENIPASVHWL